MHGRGAGYSRTPPVACHESGGDPSRDCNVPQYCEALGDGISQTKKHQIIMNSIWLKLAFAIATYENGVSFIPF